MASYTDMLRDIPLPTPSPALSLGVKRSGRETDHSPHIVAYVNNGWVVVIIAPLVFTARS
jgi:hypothetical protein